QRKRARRVKVINFEQKLCRRIRGYLDFYVNNELLIEANREILSHVEGCEGCSEELEERIRVKELLRAALHREVAPAGLQEKIQREIRDCKAQNILRVLLTNNFSYALNDRLDFFCATVNIAAHTRQQSSGGKNSK